MGAGKTTLGKAFAREMSLNFIDLDWFIEERFHKTVQQLFLERGEDGFRELERKMLHEVAEFEDVVVSTGGGTPCFFDNMEYMNDCGDTVFLDVEPVFCTKSVYLLYIIIYSIAFSSCQQRLEFVFYPPAHQP